MCCILNGTVIEFAAGQKPAFRKRLIFQRMPWDIMTANHIKFYVLIYNYDFQQDPILSNNEPNSCNAINNSIIKQLASSQANMQRTAEDQSHISDQSMPNFLSAYYYLGVDVFVMCLQASSITGNGFIIYLFHRYESFCSSVSEIDKKS